MRLLDAVPRKFGVLSVLVTGMVVATVLAPNSLNAAAARPGVTQHRAISPADTSGRLAFGYTIRHRYSDANCQSGSATTGTSYRCFTAQSPEGIFDSCWVQNDTSYVLCLEKPWQHKVARLHVTRGYDDSSGFRRVTKPWGVRLGRDVRCLVVLGPVHSAGGRPLNYRCNHHEVLAGPIRHRSATWRARAYRKVHHPGQPPSYRALGWNPVAVAWRGKPSQRD